MNKFVTAINCMDGRVQEPVINKLKNEYNIEYVDMITDLGPILILSENKDVNIINSIKKRVDISTNIHNSNLIAIIGHHDCAGNPNNKEIQLRQINKSIQLIRSWYPDIDIIGIWVNEDWETEIL